MVNRYFQIILLSSALLVTGTSCGKKYKCECTRESTGEVYALEETKLTRRSAKKWCDGNGAQNSLAYGTITCVLK